MGRTKEIFAQMQKIEQFPEEQHLLNLQEQEYILQNKIKEIKKAVQMKREMRLQQAIIKRDEAIAALKKEVSTETKQQKKERECFEYSNWWVQSDFNEEYFNPLEWREI